MIRRVSRRPVGDDTASLAYVVVGPLLSCWLYGLVSLASDVRAAIGSRGSLWDCASGPECGEDRPRDG